MLFKGFGNGCVRWQGAVARVGARSQLAVVPGEAVCAAAEAVVAEAVARAVVGASLGRVAVATQPRAVAVAFRLEALSMAAAIGAVDLQGAGVWGCGGGGGDGVAGWRVGRLG